MDNEIKNHEKFSNELLSDPEIRAKYILAREKVKLEMMLENLKTQVIEKRSQKTILGQITRISNSITQIYL
jgi:hypothetical protein